MHVELQFLRGLDGQEVNELLCPRPGCLYPIPTPHDDTRHPIPLVVLDGAGIELADLGAGLELLFQRPVGVHHQPPLRCCAFATQRLGALEWLRRLLPRPPPQSGWLRRLGAALLLPSQATAGLPLARGGRLAWGIDGRCGARRVLPPFHFGEPGGDMGPLRIQVAGLVKGGSRFGKLPFRQVRVSVRKSLER